MTIVHETVLSHLPPNTNRGSPWSRFNCPLCTSQGQSRADTKKRGNICIENHEIVYSCFNCGYKAKWKTGEQLTKKFQHLLEKLNVSQDQIGKIQINLLENNPIVGQQNQIKANWDSFPEMALPDQAIKLDQALEQYPENQDLLEVCSYLISRGPSILPYDYYWTPSTKMDMNHRLIIPYFYKKKIVGWSARYANSQVSKNTPRYYNSKCDSGFIFNNQVFDIKTRKYVIVTEGAFDAIAANGVATLGSRLNNEQVQWILASGQTPIVLPDRTKSNQTMIDVALRLGWYVSFPNWHSKIKDAAQACLEYGQLFVIKSILENKTNVAVEISVKRQQFVLE